MSTNSFTKPDGQAIYTAPPGRIIVHIDSLPGDKIIIVTLDNGDVVRVEQLGRASRRCTDGCRSHHPASTQGPALCRREEGLGDEACARQGAVVEGYDH